MATIQVTQADEVSNFEDARTWVIDREGRLHIVGTGNLASFNVDKWQAVAFLPEKTK
jgi:hypothetical protein